MAVARQGTAITVHDTADHPSIPEKWQIGAVASIPLRKGGHTLGVFDVVFGQPHFFSKDELRVLNLLADQAAIAVENAQLFLDVQRANEAKSEFVTVVSNELKAPMTSIQGYARLIALGAAGTVSQQQIDFADTILRNVERVSSLVSDLQVLSRIESGRIKITPRPIELCKVVRDAVRAVQEQIDARDHTLEIAISDSLPSVQADPAHLLQVWSNLISNAYMYTPHGGRIRVWAKPHNSREEETAHERWILCAVGDDGIGINAKDQERIFEQFHRVKHPDVSREQRGTGLGLSITRSLIELHGGHIWVESEPGQGSTFYFTLPVA
jgi:signal transduction histidine kinase